MQFLLLDLKFALRRLSKSLAFTFTTVSTLALGIAGATAIFSLTYAALIDPLPYENPATLVSIGWCGPGVDDCQWPAYSTKQISEIADNTDVFASITATSVSDAARTDAEHPEIVRTAYLTANTLAVLGAKPVLGRLSVPDDVRLDAQPVAVVSHRYWRNRLGGDAAALGRVLVINRRPRVVIGVLPPRFLWLGADAYLPIHLGSGSVIEGQSQFVLFGRLKPGLSPAQARTGLQHVLNEFARASPNLFSERAHVEITDVRGLNYSGLEGILVPLVVAAFALLVLACVNVSGLLLARAVERDREIAIRVAVGATRKQLMRQALADTLALSLCASPLGVVLAHSSLQGMTAFVPQGYLPPESSISINSPFLVAALTISFVAAVLSCIGPAWHLARPNMQSFGQALRATSLRTAQVWTLRGFVVVEIALSLVLLTIAGLFLHSALKLRSVQLPFEPEAILTLRIPLPVERYPDKASRNRLMGSLIERVRRLPISSEVALDVALPFFEFWSANVRAPGHANAERWSILHATNSGYFSIFGQTFIRGRPFTEAEIEDGRRILIVNQEFARIFLDGQDPVGMTIHLTDLPRQASLTEGAFEVIGLIEDSRATLTVDKYPQAFIPYTTLGMSNVLAVRATTRPSILAASIRDELSALDQDLAVANVQTMDAALVEQGYAAPRFQTILFGIFAACGLLLMAVGVYGMVASNVAQRRKEITIRIGLGAQPYAVSWMVLRSMLLLAAAGAAIGVPLSLAISHSAQFVLYATAWNDPIVLVIATGMILASVSFATLIPARQAARTDPVQNLRDE